MVKKEKFGKYEKYTIEAGALRAEAITLGAAIKSLRYKGRETVLGYERPEAYAQDGACLCAAVGRYANRIGGARFRLDGGSMRWRRMRGRTSSTAGPTPSISASGRRSRWGRIPCVFPFSPRTGTTAFPAISAWR